MPRAMPQLEIAAREYPSLPGGAIYLNSGCCGRKPLSVKSAIERCESRFDHNPCHVTFNDMSVAEQARAAVAGLLMVDAQDILLGVSTTNILQILLGSFLLEAGDELILTDQEHGSLRTIARHLSETRGIVLRTYAMPSLVDGQNPSEDLRQGLMSLITAKTKMVALSAIISYTGFKPHLEMLAAELAERNILLLADCAHGPGQIDCSQYFSAEAAEGNIPLWVGSGHKWLGGPNGTAFARVRSDLRERLMPVNLGDVYYERLERNTSDLSRLEGIGTSDICKLRGLTAAIDLHSGIKSGAIDYQLQLARYLRERLENELEPDFRVGNMFERSPQECTSIVNFRFARERFGPGLHSANLQEYLLQEHKIAVQLDYLSPTPGFGMRVSCHVSNTAEHIDKLVDALKRVVIK